MGKSKKRKPIDDNDKLIYWYNFSGFTLKEINRKFKNISQSKIKNRIEFLRDSYHGLPKLKLDREITFIDKLHNNFKINAFDTSGFCSHRFASRVIAMLRLHYIYKFPIDIIKIIIFMEYGGIYLINDIKIGIIRNEFIIYINSDNRIDDEVGGNLQPKYIITNKDAIKFADEVYQINIDGNYLINIKERRIIGGIYYNYRENINDISIQCSPSSYETVKNVYKNTSMGSIRSDFDCTKSFEYYFDIIKREYIVEDESFHFHIKPKMSLKYFTHLIFLSDQYTPQQSHNIINADQSAEYKVIIYKKYRPYMLIYIAIMLKADIRYFGIKDIKRLSKPIRPDLSNHFIEF